MTKEAWEVKSDGDDNPRLPRGALRSRSLEGWTERALQGKSGAMRDSVTQAALTNHTPALRSPTPCLRLHVHAETWQTPNSLPSRQFLVPVPTGL